MRHLLKVRQQSVTEVHTPNVLEYTAQTPHAHLPGYSGPFYPARLADDNGEPLLSYWNWHRRTYGDQPTVTSLADNLRLTIDSERRTTTDGYRNLCALVRRIDESKQIVVLIPELDGRAKYDRHIAFYTKGAVGENEIKVFAQDILDWLTD